MGSANGLQFVLRPSLVLSYCILFYGGFQRNVFVCQLSNCPHFASATPCNCNSFKPRIFLWQKHRSWEGLAWDDLTSPVKIHPTAFTLPHWLTAWDCQPSRSQQRQRYTPKFSIKNQTCNRLHMDHMAARALTPICRIPHASRKIGVHFSFLSLSVATKLPRRPQVLSGARKYRHCLRCPSSPTSTYHPSYH